MPNCDVLVVGAGPGGLATAVSAARHGADVLLVERRPTLSPHPRATGVSTRSMEILQSWGLDADVRRAAIDAEARMAFTATLRGPAHRVLPLGYPTTEEALAVSPVAPACCPQDHLEPLLHAHLCELGGRSRFGAVLGGLRAGDGGVRARLHDTATGTPITVDARYVVGADGAHSAVRDALGIGVEDLGSLGEFVNVQFRADLDTVLTPPRYVLYVVDPSAAREVVLPAGRDRWMYARQLRPGESVADRTPEQHVARIREVTGVPDLDVTITAVLPFAMVGQVATALRAGAGFLVGDAAHRTTPMGGTGMNTALHAAHNLGWKLAWVARGVAGPALLHTYEAERGPVGVDNVLRSLGRGNPGTGSLTHDLGTTYGGAEPASVAELDTLRPGGRAPLRRADGTAVEPRTFDGRLTLLSGDRAWRRAVTAVPGVPLAVREHDVPAGGAALVRPDGHVAALLPARSAGHLDTVAAAVYTLLDGPAPVRRSA